MALDRWQATYRDYLECGGRWMPFEEKRSALLNLLPENFCTDMFMKIPELQNSTPVDAPPDWQDMTFDRL